MAALIAAQRAQHRIPHAVSCRALGVSQSWFYKWHGGAPGPRAQRREKLKAEVGRLFKLHEGKYGAPRITADLRDDGWRVSENTVAALMRDQHLAACRRSERYPRSMRQSTKTRFITITRGFHVVLSCRAAVAL